MLDPVQEGMEGNPSGLTASGGAARLGVSVQLACCTDTLVSEIQLRESTRKDIALTYALALVSEEKTDFKVVNQAIVDRWSFSALEYIKRHAWKLVDSWKLRRKALPSAPSPSAGEGSPSSPSSPNNPGATP